MLQTFDRYSWVADLDWATEAKQVQAVEAAHDLGRDTCWFDAAWFAGAPAAAIAAEGSELRIPGGGQSLVVRYRRAAAR